jgi:hypothetical protein
MSTTPLVETEDAPQLDVEGLTAVPETDPTTRRLKALAGPGVPYVFVTLDEDGTGIDFGGLFPHELGGVLRELADHVDSKLPA